MKIGLEFNIGQPTIPKNPSRVVAVETVRVNPSPTQTQMDQQLSAVAADQGLVYGQATGSEDAVLTDSNVQRLKVSMGSPSFEMPTRLSSEEKRQFIINAAKVSDMMALATKEKHEPDTQRSSEMVSDKAELGRVTAEKALPKKGKPGGKIRLKLR